VYDGVQTAASGSAILQQSSSTAGATPCRDEEVPYLRETGTSIDATATPCSTGQAPTVADTDERVAGGQGGPGSGWISILQEK
jgi:hypothetical protein